MKKYFVTFSNEFCQQKAGEHSEDEMRDMKQQAMLRVCSNMLAFLNSDDEVMPLPVGVGVVPVEADMIKPEEAHHGNCVVGGYMTAEMRDFLKKVQGRQ